MGDVETTDITVRVLGPPKFDRHGNHEVPVEDGDGRPADLRVWSGQHGQPEWRVGSTYELERVKRNPLESKKARYETSTNSRIARLGRPAAPDVSLLHVSDTHLGRPLTDKERMADENQLGRFLDVVNLAVTHRVDAVLPLPLMRLSVLVAFLLARPLEGRNSHSPRMLRFSRRIRIEYRSSLKRADDFVSSR